MFSFFKQEKIYKNIHKILIIFMFALFADDTIRLSKKLSSLYLMHGIYNNVIPDFNRRIYDDLEHQNLYMLDLDCNYAIEILRQVLYIFWAQIYYHRLIKFLKNCDSHHSLLTNLILKILPKNNIHSLLLLNICITFNYH